VVNRRSRERVPPEFALRAGEVRKVSRLLNDYLREAGVDVEGSPAARDFAAEQRFADRHIGYPVLQVLLRAQQSMVAAADHMLGLAACIETEDVVLAPISLLRPIVVAVGMAFYVLDPEISLRERLRRGWNRELESIREQLNSFDRPSKDSLWERIAAGRDSCLAWGAAHAYGHSERNERFGERRYWLTDGESGEAPPSEIRLAEAVLGAAGDAAMGRAVYRFTSSFIHTQAHAFTLFLPAVNQYEGQTLNAVPLGMSPSDLTTWLLVMALAVDAASDRCGHYFGWDSTDWIGTVHPLMSGWAQNIGLPPGFPHADH
jgi:hypothetical protein